MLIKGVNHGHDARLMTGEIDRLYITDIEDHLPSAPFAIGFSGGGDSTALVHMLRERRPLILIVDHGLRQGSRAEAQAAADFARSLGLKTRILRWQNGAPQTGLQDKARRARYRLMGEACREAGISYLLTGHSRDDQAETLLMRYERRTGWRGAAGMARRVHGPVWPALAGITLIRPLLHCSRQQLRRYNNAAGLGWSEDPSNENTDFARIRARRYLQTRPGLRAHLLRSADALARGIEAEKTLFRDLLRRHIEIDESGLIRLERPVPAALLALLLRAAGGMGALTSPERLTRLVRQMETPKFSEVKFSGATLSGAMIRPLRSGFIIGPDPARYKGRTGQPAMGPQILKAGHSHIWAGRFAVTPMRDIKITPAGKAYLQTLPPEDKNRIKIALKPLPAAFRGAMPIISAPDGSKAQAGHSLSYVRPLIELRLQRQLQGDEI